MNNLENMDEIQKKLFDEIQNRLSTKYNLVDAVSEVLGIGTDSAYRRIRCDKLLSIKEVYLLCLQYHISFDSIISTTRTHLLECAYNSLDLLSTDGYLKYINTLAENLDKVRLSQEPGIIMSALDIPIFHLISQKELTFFKLFTWTQSVYNFNEDLNTFLRKIENQDLIRNYHKINNCYELINSSEIWTDNTIDSTLRLISYYIDIGCFDSKDFPLLLCEQILEIISKLQKWTDNGKKGERDTSFQLYISEMDLENSYILMKHSGKNNCIVKLFTINSLNVFDKRFCMETEIWLNKLIQRSTPISGNSEKERFKFFNLQKQKVRFLIDKIQNAF